MNLKWLRQRWGVGAKKCNGEILNWLNTKTSLCLSFRVTIMDSQQLQINWTTFVTFPWSQLDIFSSTVWNRSIPTYPYYPEFNSILFIFVYLTKTCTTSRHSLSFEHAHFPTPSVSDPKEIDEVEAVAGITSTTLLCPAVWHHFFTTATLCFKTGI